MLAPALVGGLGFAAGAAEGAKDYAIAIELEARRDRGVDDRQSAIDFDRRRVYRTLARDVLLGLVEAELQAGVSPLRARSAAFAAAGTDSAVQAELARMPLDLDQDQRGRLDKALARLVANLSAWHGGFSEFLSEVDRRSLRDDRSYVEAQWRRHLPQIDLNEVSERAHAASTASGFAFVFWMAPAFITMLWTLFWVARLPNGGGTIRDRVAALKRAKRAAQAVISAQ